MEKSPNLLLGQRDGLPDALRVLLGPSTRPMWEDHPEFGQLTRFWLDRHLSFRRLLTSLQSDLELHLDRRIEPAEYSARLSNSGGLFLQELQGHHGIEDTIYFPKMVALAPDVSAAFDLLDSDHHQLHDELDRFATAANGVLRSTAGPAPLERRLTRLQAFLDRHLTDEEEVIVPVILRLGERALA